MTWIVTQSGNAEVNICRRQKILDYGFQLLFFSDCIINFPSRLHSAKPKNAPNRDEKLIFFYFFPLTFGARGEAGKQKQMISFSISFSFCSLTSKANWGNNKRLLHQLNKYWLIILPGPCCGPQEAREFMIESHAISRFQPSNRRLPCKFRASFNWSHCRDNERLCFVKDS
jgi:hypothetical protein